MKKLWIAGVSVLVLAILVTKIWLIPDKTYHSSSQNMRLKMDLECTVIIPSDIPEKAIFTDKDGSHRTLKARKMYEDAYRDGWDEYLERFQNGEIDLYETQVAPILRQEYGLAMNGRSAGFEQCRIAVLDYVKKHNIQVKPLKNPIVKQLMSSGARLEYSGSSRPETDEPTGITFRGKEIADTNLEPLRSLRAVTSLDLSGTSVTDAGLEHIKSLTNLFHLRLNGTLVTDDGLEHLQRLELLEILDLSGTAVTDCCISRLVKLPALRSLNLTGTAVTDQAVMILVERPNFRCLEFGSTPVEGFGLKFVQDKQSSTVGVEQQPHYPRKNVNQPVITDTGLAELSEIKSLVLLNLQGARITDNGLKRLQVLTSLEFLNLSNTPITDTGLASLKPLKQLDHLNIGGTKISNEGLKIIAGLPKLETLDINSCEVNDDGLVYLKNSKSLRNLWFKGSGISEKGIRELQKIIPRLLTDE